MSTGIWNQLKSNFALSLTNTHTISAYFEPIIQSFASQWSNCRYRSRLIDIRRENSRTITLILKPSSKWRGFKPGQYVELTAVNDGSALTRCFSISSSLQLYKKTGHIELTIREQEHGKVTSWLANGLYLGQFLQISEAKGEFLFAGQHQKHVMIAGGSGITPFRSMLQSLKPAGDFEIELIYTARWHHTFREELERLKIANPNLKLHFIDSKITGRFTTNQLFEMCPDITDAQVYLCGPQEMNESMYQSLLTAGLDESNIHMEFFGKSTFKLPSNSTDNESEFGGKVTFAASNITTYDNKEKPTNILEMAEQNDLKPSYGCRMGVCHQCVCTKESGIVYNQITNSYSDTGEEEIQMCISVPVGDVTIKDL